MRTAPLQDIERSRVTEGEWQTEYGELRGLFMVKRRGVVLAVISSGIPPAEYPEPEQWEHVSVSTKTRCPTWEEMCWVKDQLWFPGETVLQFHPRESEYVNTHEFCLHMWRHRSRQVELPPLIMV